MNIHKYITTAFAAASLFLFISCEKEIEVDLHSSDPKLVIEGTISQNTLATVRLTMSKDFNTDNTFDPVLDAVVSISDNAGNSETLPYDATGVYKALTLKGVPGRTYNLKVLVDGQQYTATSTMTPLIVPIDSITLYPIAMFDYPFPMVNFKDPSGSKNYYRELLYINGKRQKLDDAVTTTDQREGFPISRILPVFPENNNADDPIQQGDTITIEHQCLDKGAYTFFESLTLIDKSLNNPTSNIVGGALGYFSAYTYDRKTIIATWKK